MSNKELLKIVVISILISAALLFQTFTSYGMEVELATAVSVDTRMVYMKDILTSATKEAHEASLFENLVDVPLCKAPQPGEKRHLSRAFIVMKLKNKNIDVSQIAFCGADSIDITREFSVVTVDELTFQATAFVKKQFNIATEKSAIEIENITTDLYLPKGKIEIAFYATTVKVKNGSITLQLIITSDGNLAYKKMASINVLEKKNIVVLRENIAANEIVTKNKIMECEMFIEHGSLYVEDVSEAIGKEAKINLKVGTALRPQALRSPAVIRKGEYIRATVKRGTMNVAIRVKALVDGHVGDTIRLYSQITRTHFTGIVHGADDVEVLL